MLAGLKQPTVEKGSYTINCDATSSGAKGFDGEDLALLHLRLTRIPHERNRLSAMNLIPFDIMAGDIPHRFDWEDFATYLNLVALHCLLDSSADVADTNINSSILVHVSGVLTKLLSDPTLIPVFVASFTAASKLS